MTTFLVMQGRVASELRRSNLTTEIKTAINDAIFEASATRFYFNEMRGVSFATVAGTEYYSDQNLVDIDAMYYLQGTARRNVSVYNDAYATDEAEGGISSGQLISASRYGSSLRLYPIPSSVMTVYLEGYGRLTPYPMVNDADTNAWMTEGEKYIRALAKSYLLKDVIRDFGEATIYEALAEDRKNDLLETTAFRQGTGSIRPTQF